MPEIQSGPRPTDYPKVASVDVWVPLLWLVALFVVGVVVGFVAGVVAGWLFEVVVIVAAAVYVYYNSKKFGIRGWYWLLALLFALLGLPLYAYEVHKLRKKQQTGQVGTLVQPTVATTTPSVAQQASATSPPTKFCRECGVKIPRDSVYCQECGAKLT